LRPDLLAPAPRSGLSMELPAVIGLSRTEVPIDPERSLSSRELRWSCRLHEDLRSLSLPIRTSDCPGLLTGVSWAERATGPSTGRHDQLRNRQ